MTPSILYQDDDLIAINKPSGLLVHKSWVAKDAKEFALQIVRDMSGKHVFPVHRLDRPTSGVLLFGFSGEIAQQVQAQWEQANKTYWAVVRGWLKEQTLVDHALKGMADYGQDVEIVQEAQTHFKPIDYVEIDAEIDRYPKSRFSWVEAKPKQGRTHQIRRHLKHLSHPIIGDARYGKGKYNRYITEHYDCPRLLLHHQQLEMTHPVSGSKLMITAPLEGAMQSLFSTFDWKH
ncbi:tRNA pseudouridine(65) synthase TruC [Bermanella marisrubri]|nr:pseudouridine synthase [Bermanella marisrubri]QIZ84724.1 tRNA pseudouridine(65) synthase TruC [Bermanella marisrubri]